MRLASFIGKAVLVDIPAISSDGARWYTLEDVDPAGLWLRSEALAEQLTTLPVPDEYLAPAVFVPFAQITFVFGGAGRTPPTHEELTRLRVTAAERPSPRARRLRPSSGRSEL